LIYENPEISPRNTTFLLFRVRQTDAARKTDVFLHTSKTKQNLVLNCYYTENFTNENPFPKIVHILLGILRLERIAETVSTFFIKKY